ncbi:MAG: zinc-ribbon domain-containing protein, partial [Oscillospiraceae bacterium]|nr:zinc-ribbon domain-containing protein [Oscillospiraceae bacterium]
MMFCSKCGTKALDGAEFCQKCGARLIADAPAKQSATPQANPVQQLNPIPKNTSKKKKSKLPVILGIGALMVVLLIVLASIGGKEEPSPNSSEPVSAADPSGEDRLSPNDISSPASSGFGSLCFKGVSVEQLLGASQSDMIDFLGEPDSTDLDEDKSTYGDAAIYFDVWSLSEPYLTSISSPSLSDFTYNGRALSVDLREIIGREPDDDGLYYDTYWMEY